MVEVWFEMVYSGLAAWLVVDFEVLSCRLAPNLLKSTKLEHIILPAISYMRCCGKFLFSILSCQIKMPCLLFFTFTRELTEVAPNRPLFKQGSVYLVVKKT
jgi:hypothetical protein